MLKDLLLKDVTENSGKESVQIVKRCLCRYLHMISEFWNLTKSNTTTVVNDCLTSLTEAFALPSKISTANKPTFLNSSIVFEMGVMVLMVVGRLQTSLDPEPLHSAAVAFALNFFLLMMANCNATIKKLIENSPKIGNNSTENSIVGNNLKENHQISPRRALSRLRRKKAAINFDVDTKFLDLDDDDSELSELEETALSTIDALEISSENSETGSICNENDLIADSSDEARSQSAKDEDVSGTNYYFSNNIGEIIYYETALPTIKIYCDWLKINSKLLEFCLESFDSLLSEFIQLTNLLLEVEAKILAENPNLKEFQYTGDGWKQKYPLTVDMALINFRLLQPFHSNFIDFSIKRTLSSQETSIICIESMIAFGHYLVQSTSQ